MSLQLAAIEGGFDNPVFDAQSAFHAVMQAMARPGTLHDARSLPRPPAPLSATAAAVALALCDHDTPVWLDAPLATRSVMAWLGFHTGAPVVSSPADAHFAIVSDPAVLISLDNFAQGTQAYPDRSVTLILQLRTLAGTDMLRLQGPGIETTARIAPDPLPRHFVEQWAQNNARFPRGLDLVLAGPRAIAALPRTTRIENEGA